MATKMRCLITGVDGFAASHLARKLVDEGNEVHGTVRLRNDLSKIKGLDIKLHLVEITDQSMVEKVIKEVQPDEIYHLAAQSYVKISWDAPHETYRVNVDGTLNVLEAVKKHCPSAAVLVTSSSEIYGIVDGIINETTNANPVTHYGISKYVQDMTARLYHRAFGLKVIVSRAFNITGPGRAEMFVDSSFAKQIVDIERGLSVSVIRHGNLDSARDFVDVRDVVDGYVSALRSERWGDVFCFGSGNPVKIQEILDTLISLSSKDDIKSEVDPERLRPVDTPTMRSDSYKAWTELNWKPKIPLRQSLEDLLNYWREKV